MNMRSGRGRRSSSPPRTGGDGRDSRGDLPTRVRGKRSAADTKEIPVTEPYPAGSRLSPPGPQESHRLAPDRIDAILRE